MTTDADATERAGDVGPPRRLDELPVAVRQRVIDWAAEALGSATPAEIPSALSRFARFAPTKRAKLAATALGQAIDNDAAFRALVAEWAARQALPEPDREPLGADPAGVDHTDTDTDTDADSAADRTGAGPAGARPAGTAAGRDPIAAAGRDPIAEVGRDPIAAAARGFLLRSPDEAELLAAAVEIAENSRLQARAVELERQVRVLNGRLERANAELLAGKRPSAEPDQQYAAEADRLRLRLRAQGTQIRELREQVSAGAERTAGRLAEVAGERDQARIEAEFWRQKAAAAEARADSAVAGVQRVREAKGDRRAMSDRRLELLLSALEGAASGLRREWDLVGGGPAPADVVAAGLPRPAWDGVGGRLGERTADPARLTAWAALPGAHLIVDGYNVTKTGFGELSLSDQRDRLVRSLGALAARTSAEVTVVFDGAAVAAARPPARGIRVLFSPPGVLADDVIGGLVRAEPVGRTVIVVSSDREVADRAGADGARTAASTVLLAALGG